MSELVGKELGLYRIIDFADAGGQATVFRAYHSALDREVAIKVLPEQISADEELSQRFQQEVRVIARLEHAHILPVHDYGKDRGRLYLVMRYIEAGTLKERLSQDRMEMGEISRVMHQVGSALAYAHDQGVVHRDVKPSNVLIDAQGNCYLSDFGLARVMAVSVQMTASGVGMGTPAYMSPEQGSGQGADARSDVYSLGVVLYEMVTGKVPFEGDTPLAVMLKHITDSPRPPSSLTPGVSPALEQVILKAMAKDPNDRFQTVTEMLQAYDTAVGEGSDPLVSIPVIPPSTGSLTPAPLTAKQAKRGLPRWAMIAGGVGLAALILLAIVGTAGAVRRRQSAAAATQTAVAVAETADAVQTVVASQTAAAAKTADAAVSLAEANTRVASQTAVAVQTAGARKTRAAALTATTEATRSTPEPTSTPTVTDTPSPTATATSSPTATSTPTATATATATPVPPTATPTRPVPTLLAPPYGAIFKGYNAIVELRWSEVPGLRANEYYVVRIPYNSAGEVAQFWRKEAALQVPEHYSRDDIDGIGFDDRHYNWTVQVMRCTKNCDQALDDNVTKEGVGVGGRSAQGLFYWYPEHPTRPTKTPRGGS